MGVTNLWYVGGRLDHVGYGGASYQYDSFRGDPQIICEWAQYARSTYLLDRTTGRCYESTYKKYAHPNSLPADTLLKTWRYSYNTEGRLLKRWNKNSVNESANFTYDATGDLKKITFFNATGAPIKELTLSYTPPPGESMHKNLYPMNLEVAELPDRYLRIFGRPSEHLVTQIIQMPSVGSTADSYWHSYVYSFNAGGYVTEESKYPMGATSKYGYLKYDVFTYTENKGDQ